MIVINAQYHNYGENNKKFAAAQFLSQIEELKMKDTSSSNIKNNVNLEIVQK